MCGELRRPLLRAAPGNGGGGRADQGAGVRCNGARRSPEQSPGIGIPGVARPVRHPDLPSSSDRPPPRYAVLRCVQGRLGVEGAWHRPSPVGRNPDASLVRGAMNRLRKQEGALRDAPEGGFGPWHGPVRAWTDPSSAPIHGLLACIDKTPESAYSHARIEKIGSAVADSAA